MKTQNINQDLLKRYYAHIYKKIMFTTPIEVGIDEPDNFLYFIEGGTLFTDSIQELSKYFKDNYIAIYADPYHKGAVRLVIENNR